MDQLQSKDSEWSPESLVSPVNHGCHLRPPFLPFILTDVVVDVALGPFILTLQHPHSLVMTFADVDLCITHILHMHRSKSKHSFSNFPMPNPLPRLLQPFSTGNPTSPIANGIYLAASWQ